MYALLIEHDEAQRQRLRVFLKRARYLVDEAPTYASAAHQLTQREYDFVLLGPELPDGDGFNLLRPSAQNTLPPASFIVLIASSALEDRLLSFDAGADDCLPELERRMQAIVRRRFGLKGPEIQFGPGFVMDPAARTLRHGTRSVRLSFKQFDLLHYLLLHRGHPLTRLQLGAHLWGAATAGQRASNYIDVHIKNVRKALAGFASPDFLETVHQIGYRVAA